MEILYNLLSLVVMYFAPVIFIIVTYAVVFCSISRKSTEQLNQNKKHQRNSSHMRQSGNASHMTRSKNKAKWISMLIVTVFVFCWTPFVVMSLWYMFDQETAARFVDPRVREALFVTAVSNSCLNPIIYGSYLKRAFRCVFLCGCPRVLGNPLVVVVVSATTPPTSHHRNAMNSSLNIGIPGTKV